MRSFDPPDSRHAPFLRIESFPQVTNVVLFEKFASFVVDKKYSGVSKLMDVSPQGTANIVPFFRLIPRLLSPQYLLQSVDDSSWSMTIDSCSGGARLRRSRSLKVLFLRSIATLTYPDRRRISNPSPTLGERSSSYLAGHISRHMANCYSSPFSSARSIRSRKLFLGGELEDAKGASDFRPFLRYV